MLSSDLELQFLLISINLYYYAKEHRQQNHNKNNVLADPFGKLQPKRGNSAENMLAESFV